MIYKAPKSEWTESEQNPLLQIYCSIRLPKIMKISWHSQRLQTKTMWAILIEMQSVQMNDWQEKLFDTKLVWQTDINSTAGTTNTAVWLHLCKKCLQRLNRWQQALLLLIPRLLCSCQLAAEVSHHPGFGVDQLLMVIVSWQLYARIWRPLFSQSTQIAQIGQRQHVQRLGVQLLQDSLPAETAST